jgi:prepilin-type processing-associated H-X9-DG protein
LDAAQFNNTAAGINDPLQWNSHVNPTASPDLWQWTSPTTFTGGSAGRYNTCTDAGNQDNNCRRPIARHFDGLNVAYADGHVKFARIEPFLGPLPNGHGYGTAENTWDNR